MKELDLDIMKNNQSLVKDKFWKNFLDCSTEIEQENIQQYLSSNLLNFHVMIICQKEKI